MADSPTTRPSLLVRLRDSDDGKAWAQFVDLYAPLVYGFARKRGLQDADAADLTQDVLRSVAGAIGRLDYNAARGSFGGWLFTVVRNRLRDFFEAQRRHPRGSGDSAVQEALQAHPDRVDDQAGQWDEDYERRLLSWAADQIRGEFQASTWQAFWQTTVGGASGKEVAQALGMTVAAVYLAKSRVMARLKEQVRQVQDQEGEESR